MSHKKLAIITGASKGLGKILARWLANQNYNLIITARHLEPLTTVASDLEKTGVTVHALVGDVQDSVHQQALAKIAKQYGQVDLLFNNASTLGTLPMQTLKNYDLEALTDVFRINVIAPVALVQHLTPYLSQAQGLVINLSSDAAIGGYAGWGGYGASKSALDLVSKTLASELSAEHIAVISVDPGNMRTDMHQDAFPNENISDRPLPEATLPFWGWLLGQEYDAINGRRFQAQADVWEVSV